MYDEQVTTTEQTKAKYRKEAERLARKAAEAFGVRDRDVDPREVVVYVADCWPTFARATQRLYRAALRHWLQSQDTAEAAEARAILEGNESGEPEAELLFRAEVDTQLPLRTSAKKSKTIHDDECVQLSIALRESHSEYAEPLARWVVAGILTGARPGEWLGARLDETVQPPVLIVSNGKHTNGRAHGPERTLELADVGCKDLAVIRAHIDAIRDVLNRGEWEKYLEGCAKLLQRIGKSLWPRRRRSISLYTFRHRFCSDAKSAKLSETAIAALMGHASTRTATSHYGKGRYGAGKVAVRPAARDLSAVRTLGRPTTYNKEQS